MIITPNSQYIPLIVLAFWGIFICYRSHLLREPGSQPLNHCIDPQRRLIHQLPRLHCIVKASDLEDGRDHEGNHRGKPPCVLFFLPFFFFGWERSAHDFLLNRYQKMGDSKRRCPGIFGIFEIIMHFHMC